MNTVSKKPTKKALESAQKRFDPREQRKQLGLNQHAYWSKVGVTQSGGSRFESGRKLSKPVATLLQLAYGKDPLAGLAELRGVDVPTLIHPKHH